jgi:NADH dehydrogenase (ubiquinone) 1 beta subcomplex subunit 9
MSVSPFSAAHRRYVKSLYKRMLENERNWVVRYDLWRARACVVRAEFERNRCVLASCSYPRTSLSILLGMERNVHDPRALAVILEKAEEELARKRHPDPYIRTSFPQSTFSHRSSHALQPLHSLEVQSGT